MKGKKTLTYLNYPEPFHNFEEEILKIIVVPNKNPNPYSTLSITLLLKTHILPPPFNELLLHFEYETVGCLHFLMDTCFEGLSPKAIDVIWNDFKKWMNSNAYEVRLFCFKEVMRKKNAKIIACQPTPHVLLLPAPEVIVAEETSYE